MNKYYYQLLVLGKDFGIKEKIIQELEDRIKELGIKLDVFRFINSSNFGEYTDASPSFCIYLGKKKRISEEFHDIKYLEEVMTDASLVLPIVEGTLENFSECIPNLLRGYNGISVSSIDENKKVVQIVNNILEAFSLLRKNRRVFISYKRSDSSNVAIQLYEELERHCFDVFLDTHSIRPSEPFQDELWHRMADSDVVILLNTENFLESQWTTQELAEANRMSLGMIIVNWLEVKRIKREAEISSVIQLTSESFNEEGRLESSTVNNIIESVENVRARTLASRRDNIIANFIKLAKSEGLKTHLDSYKLITLHKDKNEVIFVPAVGIPKSLNYEVSLKTIEKIKQKNYDEIYILFDKTNIRNYWLQHLKWLDSSLDIKTLSITEAPKWLKS